MLADGCAAHAVHPGGEQRPLTGTYQEGCLPLGQVLVDRGDQAGVRGLLDAEPAQGTGAVAEVQVPGDIQALRQYLFLIPSSA